MSLPSGKPVRTVAAIAAVTALAGLALNTSASASTTPAPTMTLAAPTVGSPAPVTAAPTVPASQGGVSRVVGEGVLGGSAWSVSLTYYSHTPEDFAPGHNPAALVCLSTTVDGRSASPYGDCAGVTGPGDKTTALGMYGTRTLPNGATLFTAQPTKQVVSATMTYADGRTTTVDKVTIPGTAFSAYVIPVPADRHMAGLDEYDAQHRAVAHQNF
ncbi:hypothetical protein ACFC1R_21030 [Kitasatospora sp. NPDC056138]|uniref:hypothetical protein n=1 Tax=Kitasatospora sp. NPDC056138 TaxID=3345724 RepID=UPI0035D99875